MKYLKLNKNFSQIQQAFNNNQRIVLRYNNSIVGELANLSQQQATRDSQNTQYKIVRFDITNTISEYSFNPINFDTDISNWYIDFYTFTQAALEEAEEQYGIIIPNWEEENLYNVYILNSTSQQK